MATPFGFIRRQLVRTLLPSLRQEWRADRVKANRQLEDHIAADLRALSARITHEQERLTAQVVAATQAATAMTERLEALHHEMRLLRATTIMNTEHRDRRYAPQVFDASYIEAHVSRAIAGAPLETDPTAHVYVESLLPDDTYRALLDALPPRFFFTHGSPKKPDLKLSPGDLAPEWTHRGVAFIETTLVEVMLAPLVRRFQAHMARAYEQRYEGHGAAVAALPHAVTGGRLMVRRPGYHIDPHLDPMRSVITCLIYLAKPGDSEAFGTQFFRIEGNPTIDRTSTYYPGQHGHACHLVKTAPFRPNSAIAFLNAGAAHGADIPSTAPRDTERYSYQFYVSADPSAIAAVVNQAAAQA